MRMRPEVSTNEKSHFASSSRRQSIHTKRSWAPRRMVNGAMEAHGEWGIKGKVKIMLRWGLSWQECRQAFFSVAESPLLKRGGGSPRSSILRS